MQLINIGFGNLVSAQRMLAVVSPDSAPIKRLIQEARDRGMLIDATYGRKTRRFDYGQRPCDTVGALYGAAGASHGCRYNEHGG